MSESHPTALQIAAFLLDRADQYDTDSPCWIALADAAQEIVNGSVAERAAHGELDDPALHDRLVTMSRGRLARIAVNPHAGVKS